MKSQILIILAIVALNKADIEEEITTLPPPPKPYAFGYAAGRFPGHIDRTHSEISSGTGVIQGSYSYVDPKHQIRTVDYIADKNGFHPILSHNPAPLPKDSPIVAAAKQRHHAQYEAIAAKHQNGQPEQILPKDSAAVLRAKNKHQQLFEKIAQEHARLAAEAEALKLAEEKATSQSNLVNDYQNNHY